MNDSTKTNIRKNIPVVTADSTEKGAVRLIIAELMPTSSPFILTRAPPELPGLIEASVWIKSS